MRDIGRNFRKIHIQTTNTCNGHCIMCPFDEIYAGQKAKIMSDELWAKIVLELAQHEFNGTVSFSFNYEPFMDPKLVDRVASLHSIGAGSIIVTNGTLLTRENLEAMKGHLFQLILSVPGIHKEIYENRIAASYDQLIDNIHLIADVFKEDQSPTQLALAFTFFDKAEYEFLQGFLDQIGPDARRFELMLNEVDSRGGYYPQFTQAKDSGCIARNVFVNSFANHYVLCPSLWDELCIYYDGKVPLCKWDYDETRIIGDVNTDQMYDIFFDAMEAFRIPLLQAKAPTEKCALCLYEFKKVR